MKATKAKAIESYTLTRDSLKTPELSGLHYLVHLEDRKLSILACIPAAADERDAHLMRTPSTLRGPSLSNVL